MSELHLTRVYRAPRTLVWQAWTDPAHVANWWGPRGFSLTHHSKDLRVGGSWVYTMHGPDGVDYPNSTTYLEVIEGERLVYDHGSDGQSKPLFRVTVTFADVAEGTQMDMTMAFENDEVAKSMGEVIRKHGGNSTWDRLAEYLEKEAEGTECFVIHRSFTAPRELVFKLWTETQHLAEWLPTTGVTMEYLQADIRPGGEAIFRMDHPGGVLYAKVQYHNIQAPELLTYTQMFSDQNGGPGRHPMLPVFPDMLHTTVHFIQEGPAQTRVCVTCRPAGEVSAQEIAAFLETRDGMAVGWTGSFEKFETHLDAMAGSSGR